VTTAILAAALPAVVLAWAALPFLPALAEFRARRDVAPLRIREHDRDDRRAASGALGTDARRFLRTPGSDDALRLLDAPTLLDGDAAPVVIPGAASFADTEGTHVAAPLYVHGPHQGGAGDHYVALYSAASARLGPGTTVRDWLHADADLTVEADSRLGGSTSAGRVLTVASGCRFERLHAPLVQIGSGTPLPPPTVPSLPLYTPAGTLSAGRTLVHGDLTIPPRHVVRGALVVTGALRIGAGARIEGDVKAHGTIVLESGATVAGHLFAESDVWVEAAARVEGALATEARLELGPNVTVGTPTSPSSVSARRIVAAAGVRVHGTLWALDEGITASR